MYAPESKLSVELKNDIEFWVGQAVFKVFWSSRNGSFVFNQIFVDGTLMGVDYKSEKKI